VSLDSLADTGSSWSPELEAELLQGHSAKKTYLLGIQPLA